MKRSKLSAPWRDQQLQPVDGRQAVASRAARPARSRLRCRRESTTHPKPRQVGGADRESDRTTCGPSKPTEVQLTSRSAARRRETGVGPQLGAQPLGTLGGSVPDPHLAARRRRAAPRPRLGRCPRRRAPARSGRDAATGSASISAGASVLSAATAPPASKVSVLAAPIARARGVGLGGQRQRRLLVGDGHVDAAETGSRQRPHELREQTGGDREQLVAPVRQARRPLARRSASPVSGCGPPASPAPRGAAPSGSRRQRSPSTGKRLTERQELGVVGGEHAPAAGTAWRRSTGTRSGRDGRPPASRPGRGCRSASAAGPRGCGCCTASGTAAGRRSAGG